MVEGVLRSIGAQPDNWIAWVAARLSPALSRLVDPADVFQEAVYTAWTAREGCWAASEEEARAWFLGVLRHCVPKTHQYHTARKRGPPAGSLPQGREGRPGATWPARPDHDPVSVAILREEIARVVRALPRLPMRQREAFLLVYMNGLSVKRMARKLGLGAAAARKLLWRARRALRNLLARRAPKA